MAPCPSRASRREEVLRTVGAERREGAEHQLLPRPGARRSTSKRSDAGPLTASQRPSSSRARDRCGGLPRAGAELRWLLPAPPGYLQRVREICDEYDVLYVSDETICAYGRIGDYFATKRYGVQPDIITSAKGLTSGYAPLGAMVVSDRLFEPFKQGQNYFAHGYTWGGHPVAAAVALANLDIFEREGINEHVQKNEGAFRSTLEKLNDLPIVGDVRGDGYFYGIELVKDKTTKKRSTTTRPSVCCAASCRRRCSTRGSTAGPTTGVTPSIQLAPPLIVGQKEFDEIEQTLRSVLTEAWSIL